MSEIFNYLKGDSSSQFPTKVDPLLFVQDTKISTKEFRDSHAENLKLYPSLAGDMLEANEKFTPIGACLINSLVNRIYATQDYLLNNINKIKHIEITSNEPTDLFEGKMWYALEE